MAFLIGSFSALGDFQLSACKQKIGINWAERWDLSWGLNAFAS